jgi:phosphoglycerate dehydrogenase-like enzyme
MKIVVLDGFTLNSGDLNWNKLMALGQCDIFDRTSADLVVALNEMRIAGAGLDVLSTEPPEKNNPLLTSKNCVITPHISWATKQARERLLTIAVENIVEYLNGNVKNVVS